MIADEPTVPNVILVPLMAPVSLCVLAGAESVMWPVSLEPFCRQLRLNVPEYAPLYRPDQLPERSTPEAVVDAATVGGVDDTDGVEGLESGAVDVLPVDGGVVVDEVALLALPLLHPAANAARSAMQASSAVRR